MENSLQAINQKVAQFRDMMTERRRLELERDSMHEELQKLENKKIQAREKLANIKDVNEAKALLEELIGIPCVEEKENENENVGTNGDVGEVIYGKLVLAESYSSDIIWMLSNVDEGDYLKKAAKKVDQCTKELLKLFPPYLKSANNIKARNGKLLAIMGRMRENLDGMNAAEHE